MFDEEHRSCAGVSLCKNMDLENTVFDRRKHELKTIF